MTNYPADIAPSGSNGSSQNDLQFLSASSSNSTTSSTKRSSTGGAFLFHHNQSSPHHHLQQVVANNTIPPPNHNIRHNLTSRSTPNSPRMVPRRAQSTAGTGGVAVGSSGSYGGPESSPWLNLANLTEYLDVHQLNNYQQNLPEVSVNSAV